MIDRDFEQVSEEHMKSLTKPEGPAQEPGSHDRGCPIWVGGKCRCTTYVPATPAPSQPAGAREQVMEALDWWQRANSIRPTIVWNALCAARDALLERRERDSLREQLRTAEEAFDRMATCEDDESEEFVTAWDALGAALKAGKE